VLIFFLDDFSYVNKIEIWESIPSAWLCYFLWNLCIYELLSLTLVMAS
jgi:hypothetical protein